MKGVEAFFAMIGAFACAMPGSAFAQTADWPVLKTYEGENLRRVKMPIGGIGTGTISLAGRGALVDWEIRNAPAKGFTPSKYYVGSGFWLRTEDPDGRVTARLLEGPLDTIHYEGAKGSAVPNHGFPRFGSCRFKTAYPLAQVELSDPSVPVGATLEAMNPLVAEDAEASGIPAALLRWKLVNTTSRPLKVSVLGIVFDPMSGERLHEGVSTNGMRGVWSRSKDDSPVDSTVGEVALMVPASAGDVSVAETIVDHGWRAKMGPYWKRFVATGQAEDVADPLFTERIPAVAVAVSLTLEANETRRVPFFVGWRFPHREAWPDGKSKPGPFAAERDVGNHYAKVHPSAPVAVRALMDRQEELEAKTVDFVRGILASSAPDVVKEAALFNLSTFRTETCFRTADGHFYGWEGIQDEAGSCYGSCTHVWGYEHALVDLWPELARDMLDTQFGPSQDERGHMSFRVGLPIGVKPRMTIACADGQMQCIIKAYEYWKKRRADAWLRERYACIRRALAFCWTPGGWDADKDGVMEGCQHNTMDVEYYGPNPQMQFLYLGAIKALEAMAEATGDNETARTCAGLYANGSAWTEKNLFNGSYYEQAVVPPKGPVSPDLTYGNAKDLSDPDFQIAAGCLIDQLLGDYATRHVGLGPVVDERHADVTLDTILARNASTSIGPFFNLGRTYAYPDEPALKMAWYPEGRMPRKPFPYYGENMTGFEYVVAASLAQRGRLAEAEKVVRDIRSRYDGKKRNPFDEAECGHHYVRALAAWTVYKAWAQNGQQE